MKLAGAKDGRTLVLPLPGVTVSLGHGLPLPGRRTAQMKVLSEVREARALKLELEAPAGCEQVLKVVRNGPGVRPAVAGAELKGEDVVVRFPAGVGYQRQAVTLTW